MITARNTPNPPSRFLLLEQLVFSSITIHNTRSSSIAHARPHASVVIFRRGYSVCATMKDSDEASLNEDSFSAASHAAGGGSLPNAGV